MNFFRKSLLLSILFVFALRLLAQEPQGYYSSAEGKSNANLKTALHKIIRQHTFLDYDISTNTWWYTYFKSTDWNPNGYFWDMYSNNKRQSYSGSLMNREHCMPRSWWGNTNDYPSYQANGDLVNLTPSDAAANTEKSNFPLGEVGTATYTNGVVKVGNNTFPGYNGMVFEPANEYKGDFARTYLYMVTCYEDYSSNWHGSGTLSMLNSNTYPVFKPWAIDLLLKWHKDDPVSDKEINRNKGVYTTQGNRNPFIDHPELVDFIWGKRNTERWSLNVGASSGKQILITKEPVNSILKVNIYKPELSTYSIKALSGLTVKTGTFTAEGTLTVDELHDGMYLLVIYSDGTRYVVKFRVRHFQ